jgi:hypothetical protein
MRSGADVSETTTREGIGLGLATAVRFHALAARAVLRRRRIRLTGPKRVAKRNPTPRPTTTTSAYGSQE